MRVLIRIAETSEERCAAIVHGGALPITLKLLQSTLIARQSTGFSLIRALVKGRGSTDREFMESGIIHQLVQLIQVDDGRTRSDAMGALCCAMLNVKAAPSVVVNADGVPKLVEIISSADDLHSRRMAAKVLKVIIFGSEEDKEAVAQSGVLQDMLSLLGPSQLLSPSETFLLVATMHGTARGFVGHNGDSSQLQAMLYGSQ